MSEPESKKPTRHCARFKTALETAQHETDSRYVFPLSEIRSRATSVLPLMRAALEEHGVVVVSVAFTEAAFAEARAAVREAYRQDVEPQLDASKRPAPGADILEIAKHKEHWPTGVIGNKSFGYLIAQPQSASDTPRVSLRGMNVAVQPCSAYKANLTLLEHETSQLTLATLLAVTGNQNGMISQDSVKVHREALTKPHVDIYGSAEARIHRVQAMAIGPGEGTVRLCFARFTHRSDVQKRVCDLINQDDFYFHTGFRAIPARHRDAVIGALTDAGVFHVGSPGELVIWRSGVIHSEMKQSAGSLLFRADSSTTVERYIVGTHQPCELSQENLLAIGALADQGFLFACYHNLNKANAAGANSVHLKTTQYKRYRVPPPCEKERLQAAARFISNYERLQNWRCSQSARHLHCVGVTQPAERIFTDPVALRIFKQDQ